MSTATTQEDREWAEEFVRRVTTHQDLARQQRFETTHAWFNNTDAKFISGAILPAYLFEKTMSPPSKSKWSSERSSNTSSTSSVFDCKMATQKQSPLETNWLWLQWRLRCGMPFDNISSSNANLSVIPPGGCPWGSRQYYNLERLAWAGDVGIPGLKSEDFHYVKRIVEFCIVLLLEVWPFRSAPSLKEYK